MIKKMKLGWSYTFLFVIFVDSRSRPVDRYKSFWTSPYRSGFHYIPYPPSGGNYKRPDGAYTGNGDIGVVLGCDAVRPKSYLTGSQSIQFGKNDFWMSDSTSYFAHLSAAKLNISLPGGQYNGNMTQDISHATVNTVVNSSNMSLSSSTIVGENNVVLTTLRCTSELDCPISMVLSDTGHNHYKLTERSGGDATSASLWFRKENLHSHRNPAYLGSCNPDQLLYSTQRSFVIHSNGSLRMANSSCLWVIQPNNLNVTDFGTGDCSKPQGKWIWRPVHQQDKDMHDEVIQGDIVFQGFQKQSRNNNSMQRNASAELCLDPHGEKLSLTISCGNGSWIMNMTTSYLQVHHVARDSGPKCLVVVPDNSNNTLGVAITVINSTGNPVIGKISPVNRSDQSAGMRLTTTLKAGREYIVMTALLTLRDLGCAGIWSESQKCKIAPEVAALNLLQTMTSASSRQNLVTEQALFWSSWWNASSIDLLGGSLKAPEEVLTLERWYYSMQYALGVTTRQGKIAPSLIGNLVVVEPVAWGDQLTYDYNFEAVFWGAGSSNHMEVYKPYIATVTNPGAVAVARARATNPGAWTHHGGTEVPVGKVVGIGACDQSSHWSDMGFCPDLSEGKGFRGTSWPDTGFPLGDGRVSYTDGQTRFTGALMATDMIQYFEFSRDEVTLNNTIYPFIRDNADFYVSYVRKDKYGNITFPYTCAQEECACRNMVESWPWRWGKHHMTPTPNSTKMCKDPTGPGGFSCTGSFYNTKFGEHDAHADIAFAKQSLRKAIEYSELLNLDSQSRLTWKNLLVNLPAYPTVSLHFLNESLGSEFNGQTLFVEARTGHVADMILNTSIPGGSGQIWPWCNVEYPISNFAAIWPTNDIGIVQTADDPELLAAAKSTIWALNNYAGYVFTGSFTPWANGNGFCLSWPPAVRVSTQADAVDLLAKFKVALDKTMGENGLIYLSGGNLENIGATLAVNDMLIQGHAGRLRFFPVWNATALGPASFHSLRTYGAFLVSAAVDRDGIVSPVNVISLQGMPCTFESPWKKTKPTVTSGGIPVSISPVLGEVGVFLFNTSKAIEYVIAQGKLLNPPGTNSSIAM